jgi:hypothetical protein
MSATSAVLLVLVLLVIAAVAYGIYRVREAICCIPVLGDLLCAGSYGRGAGVLPGCPSGQVEDAGLCYPACELNYTGVGPVCWEDCPAGFTDVGIACAKPPAYGRGAGYITQGRCESAEGKACEEWGLLWYPVCDPNFHNFGCCICTPNCPPDMKDTGAFCEKNSYGRGVGTIPGSCAPGYEIDAGLCYPLCKPEYTGVGPVCWKACSAGAK